VKAYGALGVSLVVLSFLGYVSSHMLILGFLLVLVDAYTAHLMQKDVEQIKHALLTGVGLLWYTSSDEEPYDEEEE